MDKRILGALLICGAAIAWGFDGVVLTPRLYNLSVPFVVFLIHAVPFVLMQPFLYKSYLALKKLSPQGWLSLFLVAGTGGALGTLAIVKALFLVNFHHLSVVVLLQKLQPLFAILLAALLLKERVSWRFLGWAVLAICGAYLLTFGLALPDMATGDATALAAMWAVIAAAAFGSATVFGKQLLGKLDFKEATFGRFGMTAVIMLVYLLVTGVFFPFGTMSGINWLIILIIAITTGSGAIFVYYYGLTRVKASVSTICELCLPLSAILFDWIINGSVLAAWQWVGAAVLIGAILRITLQQAQLTSSG